MPLSELCSKFENRLAEFCSVTGQEEPPWKEIGRRAHELCSLAQMVHLETSDPRGPDDPLVEEAIRLLREYLRAVESLSPGHPALDKSTARNLEICKMNSERRIKSIEKMREARREWRRQLDSVATVSPA